MTTISNNAVLMGSQKAAGVQAGPARCVQGPEIGGLGSDQLVLKPGGPFQLLRPSREQLAQNLQTAEMREAIAEWKVQQAQRAVDDAQTPMDRMFAAQRLLHAKYDLHGAKVQVAKAQVALDARDSDDANQAVANAEKAVMAARTPWGRMIAMKQLEAASKQQAKAQDQLTKDQQTLTTLESELVINPNGLVF